MSSEVKWIKLSTDIFNNRKIKQIEQMPDGDSLIVIWIKLLILAGKTNHDGSVYFTEDIPYTDQLLSVQFNRSLSTIQLALSTFERFGMIEIVNDLILVSNWEKYQSVDGLDKIREQNRLRQQRSRERKKLLSGSIDESSRDSNVTDNVTVTQSSYSISNTSPSLSLEEDKDTGCGEKEKKPREGRKTFVKPTIEEIASYCKERNNGIDPEEFFDKYESNGWVIGKNGNPMKDWKATIRTWERNEKKGAKSNPRNAAKYDYGTEEDYDEYGFPIGKGG